ncbi:MAG: hypothetical protein U0804_03690 [Gemmataceae bacterium]
MFTASPASPPNSRLRSIFSPPTTPVSAPAIAADLYSGKMIACWGHTRLHAGQPFLHWSWFSVTIRSRLSTPYTPNRQKSRHSRQFVQRL